MKITEKGNRKKKLNNLVKVKRKNKRKKKKKETEKERNRKRNEEIRKERKKEKRDKERKKFFKIFRVMQKRKWVSKNVIVKKVIESCLLCFSTADWVLCMPFAG